MTSSFEKITWNCKVGDKQVLITIKFKKPLPIEEAPELDITVVENVNEIK